MSAVCDLRSMSSDTLAVFRSALDLKIDVRQMNVIDVFSVDTVFLGIEVVFLRYWILCGLFCLNTFRKMLNISMLLL